MPCTTSTSSPAGRTRVCATSSRGPRARVDRCTRSTARGSTRWPATGSTRAWWPSSTTRCRTSRWTTSSSPADTPPLLLVLDGVTDPHNLGACLRSADAFGAQAVIVPKDRAVGVNATVAKAACGAADTVPVVAVTNLSRAMREMKERGIWLLGADAGGESLFTADLSGPVAWVLGAEGAGLRRLTRESCDRIVGIPLAGQRREPQRLGGGGHLPVCDAGRAGTGLGPRSAA